jgi:hypothetical protein
MCRRLKRFEICIIKIYVVYQKQQPSTLVMILCLVLLGILEVRFEFHMRLLAILGSLSELPQKSGY